MSFQPYKLSFKDVLKLMDKCDKLDENPARAVSFASTNVEKANGGNPLLIGIIPGKNIIMRIEFFLYGSYLL